LAKEVLAATLVAMMMRTGVRKNVASALVNCLLFDKILMIRFLPARVA